MSSLETTPLEDLFITEDNISQLMNKFTVLSEKELEQLFDRSKIIESPFLKSCFRQFGSEVLEKKANPEVELLRKFLRSLMYEEDEFRYTFQEELRQFFGNIFNKGFTAELKNPLTAALMRLSSSISKQYFQLIGVPSGDMKSDGFKRRYNVPELPTNLNEFIERGLQNAISEKLEFSNWFHNEEMRKRREQIKQEDAKSQVEKGPRPPMPPSLSRMQRKKEKIKAQLRFYQEQVKFLSNLDQLLQCSICIE